MEVFDYAEREQIDFQEERRKWFQGKANGWFMLTKLFLSTQNHFERSISINHLSITHFYI